MNVQFGRNMRIDHNVQFRVFDRASGALVKTYEGHNQATNTMLTGIAHYLQGDGILNQGIATLGMFVPKYISLGVMGLMSQEEDENGLPTGISGYMDDMEQGDSETDEEYEIRRFTSYMQQTPSYGADGYYTSDADNNNRPYFGLGPAFGDRPDQTKTISCELISKAYPRSAISYRSLIPEDQSETPQTIDVIFSAMVSTGALAQFRETGKDYVFITEAGLWSTPTYSAGAHNGLLAGYRIAPPNENNWDMTVEHNRDLLKQQVIRVGINQVVQVIWKIQIGSIGQLQSRVYDTSIYIGQSEV